MLRDNPMLDRLGCMNTHQVAFHFHNDSHLAGCESVAEHQVLFALVRSGWCSAAPANDNGDSPSVLTHHELPTTVGFQQLLLEHVAGVRLRADFVFRDYFSGRSLVVEIDGARYHCTAQRVARDKAVDRQINSRRGWTIHRYVAAEVLAPHRADRVVSEIERFLRSPRLNDAA